MNEQYGGPPSGEPQWHDPRQHTPWHNQPEGVYGPPPGPVAGPQRKRRTPVWLAVAAVGVVALLCMVGGAIAVAGLAGSSGGELTAAPDRTEARATAEPASGDKDDEAEKPKETEKPPADPEPAEPELTASQEQAVGVAQDYLDYSGFSRKGLIEQLEYEGFSTKDAEFAVDYVDADWKEQAARVAQSYLEYSHFSRQGLIEQLEYEGFTRAQAEYGVEQAGL